MKTINKQNITKQTDKLFDLLESINNNNSLILNADKSVNKSIDNIVNELIKNVNNISRFHTNYNTNVERVYYCTSLENFLKVMKLIWILILGNNSWDIDLTVKRLNEEIRNIGFFKLLFNKKNINLKVDTDKLENLFRTNV